MYSSLLALVTVALAPAATPEVTATQLDGQQITGQLRAWDQDHVTIAAAEGDVQLAARALLSIRWNEAPPRQSAAGSSSAQVELIDGTRFPIKDFISAAGTATISPAAPRSAGDSRLALSRKQMAAVQLQPLSPAAWKQWKEIRALEPAGDLLVLLKRDGASLDYVEGVLGDVATEKIEFELEGEPLRIDRSKVAGFIYYRRGDEHAAEPACIVRGQSGLRAHVTESQLVDGVLHLTTVAGVELSWPLDDVDLADFSAGKLVYLSDLEPLVERWTPLVGLPTGATLAAEYGRPRRDQSAYGGPLTLRHEDANTVTSLAPPRPYPKGLALRSRTEMAFRVPDGFRRFAAVAGIDPASTPSGHVRFEVYGDNRLLIEDEIAGHESPRPIDFDITGIKRLKLVVDFGPNLDTGDWLNLCDARLVK